MKRVSAIGGAELRLLWRNRTALINAVVTPLAIGVFLASLDIDLGGDAGLLIGMFGFTLAAVVYYNLVSVFVARREELVLKRLRTGEAGDGEILAGVASPAVAVAVGQILLFALVGAFFLDIRVPVNPIVLLAGVVGGVAVFVVLAAASAIFTRTVEMAQVTTLPLLMACLFGSGLTFPLDGLPDAARNALSLLPLSPVVDLMRLGWTGTVSEAPPAGFGGVFAPAALPALLLVAWVVLGGYAIRRWFAWEPRR